MNTIFSEKDLEDIIEILSNSSEYQYMKDAIYQEHLAEYEEAKEILEKHTDGDESDDGAGYSWVRELANPSHLDITPAEVISSLFAAATRYRLYRETEYFTIENGKHGVDYSVPYKKISREDFKEIVKVTVGALECLSNQIQGYSYEDTPESLVKEDLEEVIRTKSYNKCFEKMAE